MSPVDWGPGEYGTPPDPRPREVLPLLVSENSLPMGTSSHLPRDNLKGVPPAGALVRPTHGWGTRGSLSHLLPTLSLFLQCLGSVPDPRPTVISQHSSQPLSLCSHSGTKVWFLSKCLVIGPTGAEQGRDY